MNDQFTQDGSEIIETKDDVIVQSAQIITELNKENASRAKELEQQYKLEREQAEKEKYKEANEIKQRLLDERYQKELQRRKEFEEELKRLAEAEELAKQQKKGLGSLFKKKEEQEEVDERLKDEVTGLLSIQQFDIDKQNWKFNSRSCVLMIGVHEYEHMKLLHLDEQLIKESTSLIARVFQIPCVYRITDDLILLFFPKIELKTVKELMTK